MAELLKNSLAAGLSAGFSACVVSPIDTLRVRWQVQVQQRGGAAAASTASSSILQFGRHIVGREGLLAGLVLPGLAANASAIAVCSGIRFGIYPTVRDGLAGSGSSKSAAAMTAAGFISGAIGYCISTPLWNWKTNAQARPELVAAATAAATTTATTTPTTTAAAAAATTATTRSSVTASRPRQLFRGATSLVIRGACLSAGGMLGYDGTKTFCKERQLASDGPALHLAASIVSAFCGTVLAAPADVCMTYVTTARQRGEDFRGNVPALRALIATRGLAGLFRGWPLFFLRMAPAFAVNLTLYEQARRLLGLAYFA